MFHIRVYIDVFHDLIFSYYLTDTQTLTFGNIKWTPDVAPTVRFLNVVLPQSYKEGRSKQLPPKIRDESLVASVDWQSHPWCHVRFTINEMLECKIKVHLGNYYVFY